MKTKFDAACPACGAVVKRDSVSGRYEYHAFINGCRHTVGDEPPEPDATALRSGAS